MNFREASRRLEADLSTTETGMTSDWPTDRPTIHQPDIETDGLDPATVGGPSPLNSGVGPYGNKVVSDPLVPVPGRDKGGPIPHMPGPDVDTTVLKHWRERS
jgi:hypothetical protein